MSTSPSTRRVEEKATLLQAVEMLNKKSDAIKESGRIVGTDKIVVMAALNVVHDLLKTTLNDDLAIGEFERRITDMNNACQKHWRAWNKTDFPLFPAVFAKAYIPLNQYVRFRLPGAVVGASVRLSDAPETTRGDRLVSKVQADSA